MRVCNFRGIVMFRTLSFVRALVSVALLSLLAEPACAEAEKVDLSAQYLGCDGFYAASDASDNMTTFAGILSLYNLPAFAGTHTVPTNFGASAVADCDRVLAAIPAKHWMRKVNLLRARALHHLEARSPQDALADIDAAEAAAAGKGDAYYLHSLGWSLDIVRAYALRRAGDQPKASALALAALQRNPFNRLNVVAALEAIGPDASASDIRTVQLAITQLAPVVIGALFSDALKTGRYDEVLKLHSQLTPPEEIGQVRISGYDQAGRNWRNFRTGVIFWASCDGAYAYALAASGRNDEAIAAISAARARLEKDTQPPPPLSEKQAKDNEAVALHTGDVDIRVQSAQEGKGYIDKWERWVQMRIAASQGKGDLVFAALNDKSLPGDWTTVDLVETLRNTLAPAERTKLPSTLALQQKLLLSAHKDVPDVAPIDLLRVLPEAETSRRVPSYSEGASPWFGHSETAIIGEGYRVSEAASIGVDTIGFRGDGTEPQAVIEEMALLCAADQARRKGKTGLIIVGRQDIESTLTRTVYGRAVSTQPHGFETVLKVVFVDPTSLPDQFKDGAWRVLDVNAIYSALAPLYIKPAASR